MKEKPAFPQFSFNEAMNMVIGIMQEELRKGAIDSEPSAFKTILTGLQNGSILPNDAVAQARLIAGRRYDSH